MEINDKTFKHHLDIMKQNGLITFDKNYNNIQKTKLMMKLHNDGKLQNYIKEYSKSEVELD